MHRTNYASRIISLFVIFLAISWTGCQKKQQQKTLRLATTTSTENSGLLDVLLPVFEKKTGIKVHVLPMGTGKALRTARDGNCDVVLVHAPAAEKKFVNDGWGLARHRVMVNDFLLLGPPEDPAHIKGMASPPAALKAIAAGGFTFTSRGDNSGTHKKEMELWAAASINPSGHWYRSVGKGMGEALTMASEMKSYVLADRGTFIKFRDKIDLVPLVQGDQSLHNPYGIIAVNPEKHPHVKQDEATRFIDFLTSDEARELIENYRLQGEILFHPWPKDKTH